MKEIIFLTTVFLFFSCGSDNPTTATSSATSQSTAYPNGLAFASAFSTQSGSSLAAIEDGDIVNIQAFDSTRSYSEKAADLAAIVAASSASACQVQLPTISAPTEDTDCYGPGLDYSNHINATTTDGDDNGTSSENTSNSDDGRLPTGDLGLWSATDTSTTSACSAAKVNSLINGASDKIDAALLVIAAMNCQMSIDGVSLPSAGSSETITTSLNTAIQTNNANVTVSSATIARASTDVNGNPSYTYTIAYSDSGTNISTSMTLRHSPTNSTGTEYIGKLSLSIEGVNGGVVDSFAFSLLYSRTSSTLNYQMLSGGYNKSGGNAHPSALFTSNGTMAMQSPISASMVQLLADISTTNGTGNISYSWQAGTGDRASRVFNAYSTTTEGCGFFGYGGNYNVSTGSIPDNSITKFFCNWAGPNNDMTGISGKGQKQCMTVSSGKYINNPSKVNITYAPTTSCDFDGSSQNSSSREFNYGLTSASGPSDFSNFAANYTTGTPHSAVSNDLVTISSDTDFANYTAPSAPTDPF